MEDFNKLTDEELRVEVAKALGWTCTKYEGGTYRSNDPANWTWFHTTICAIGCGFGGVPDFPRDLNACHEFEAWLLETKGELAYKAYAKLLQSLDGSHTTALAKAAFATARQRCLALLATLEPEA